MRGGDGGSPHLRKQQEYRTPLKTAQSDKKVNTSQSNLRTTPQIWRSQSESFRTALKAARDVTAALASGNVRMSTCSYPDMSDTGVMPFYMHFRCFVHRYCFVVVNQF
jgi:hypothetical protein